MYLKIFWIFIEKFFFFVDRVYALYDYDGCSINNIIFNNRHIKVNEGDELEIIEDDDEHLWKVKNLRTNDIGLIPATIVTESQKTIQRSSTTLV
jgi:hypothetical protein